MQISKINKNDRDNVYFNISFNTDYENDFELHNKHMYYSSTKNSPIVDKANDYYLSVVSFSLPLNGLPICIFPIVADQIDPDLSKLNIAVKYNGVDHIQNVKYYSQFDTNVVPKPTQVGYKTQNITDYYFVYEYQWVYELINRAIKLAHNAAAMPNVTDAPYFYYNSATQLVEFIFPDTYVSTIAPNIDTPTFKINRLLFQFIDGFPWYAISRNAPSGLDVEFKMDFANLHDNNIAYSKGGHTYYKVIQSLKTVVNMNPIKKIVMKTDLISVGKEYVSTNGANNPSEPILTDFILNLNDASDSRSIAYYSTSGEYRLVDLISDLPVEKISLSLYWYDQYNNSFPLNLKSFSGGTIKMVFLKKDLYKKV